MISTRGVALTEVLVMLVLFGITLTGVLDLLVVSNSNLYGARQAQLAAALAADLSGRIASLPGVDWTTLIDEPCRNNCPVEQLAAYELDDWRSLLFNTLPAADFRLETTAENTLLMVLEWSHDHNRRRQLRLAVSQ